MNTFFDLVNYEINFTGLSVKKEIFILKINTLQVPFGIFGFGQKNVLITKDTREFIGKFFNKDSFGSGCCHLDSIKGDFSLQSCMN